VAESDAALEAALKKNLGSRTWRLNNLYWILDKNGNKIKFAPNPAQLHLLGELWYLNLIVKARQRGFTTLIDILMLDACLFNSNVRAGIVADTRENVEIIFRDKIKFAYDNLPPSLKGAIETEQDQAKELLFGNNSSIRVGTSMRSGTLQYLHISEFGKICRRYPEKAQEIITGSLQAVQAGNFVFIESTSEGRGGPFYDMVKTAEADKKAGRSLSVMEYKLHFFSWWDADEYEIDQEGVIITDADTEYFAKVESKIGLTLSPRKRAWYVLKKKTLGDKMKQEFPSTIDEAFDQSVEGAYYVKELSRARLEGRICHIPVIQSVPVDTFWDIGRNDANAIWFMQHVGMQHRFIRFYENSGEGLAHYAKYLQEHGYLLGKIYVPHDAGHLLIGQEYTVAQQLQTMLPGCSVIIVPRINDVTDGINMVREQFQTWYFDEQNCSEGIKHLDNYRKEWNEKLGVWRDHPRHDDASNAADAIRQHAQGYRVGSAQTGIDRQRVRSNWKTA
jgi:hypothetical protein